MFDAAEKFLNRVESLIEMLILDSQYDNEIGVTKIENRPLVETFRQSVVILPIAFFEDFLRTLVEQYIDKLNSSNPRVKWENLPVSLRKAHIFNTAVTMRKKSLDGNDDIYQSACLGELKAVFEKIVSPIVTPDRYLIVAESFTHTNSNPSSDTVRNMFKIIGINNIFEKLSTSLIVLDPAYTEADSVKRKLDEIVEKRHGVAHGRPASSITREELIQNLVFLQCVVIRLQMITMQFYGQLLRTIIY